MTTALAKRETTALVKVPQQYRLKMMRCTAMYVDGHKFMRELNWTCETCGMKRSEYRNGFSAPCGEPQMDSFFETLLAFIGGARYEEPS